MKAGRCVSEKKARVRQESVIDWYREYKYHSLPKDKEYWTLANLQGDTELHEYGQLVASKLLEPQQFHGVDTDDEIIKKNRNALPKAHWYKGDFLTVIQKALKNNGSNPGLIYYDSTEQLGVLQVERFLKVLESVYLSGNKDCMAIYNFIATNPYHQDSISDEEITRRLCKSLMWERAIEKTKWKPIPKLVRYQSGRTGMASIYFILD